MGAVLAQRTKVNGIIEMVAYWQSKLDEKKNKFIAGMQERRENRINERVRNKILRETYQLLGTNPDKIQGQLAEIKKKRERTGFTGAEGSIDHLNATMSVANGAIGASNADKRDIATSTIAFGLLAANTILNPAEAITMQSLVTSLATITGMSFLGPLFTAATLASAAYAIYRIAFKRNKGNNADASLKLDDAEKELKEFEAKLKSIESELIAEKDNFVKAYKSMKKAEFNKFLKDKIKAKLLASGLITGGIGTNTKEIEEEIVGKVDIESNIEKEEPDPENIEENKQEQDDKEEIQEQEQRDKLEEMQLQEMQIQEELIVEKGE